MTEESKQLIFKTGLISITNILQNNETYHQVIQEADVVHDLGFYVQTLMISKMHF